ncbi:hypothetical protein Tco_0495656 [Tanacetum coccineum]
MPTPPSSQLISLSPPSAGERIARCTTPSTHSPPPPMPSPLLPSSGCPTQIQTLRIASTQALVDAAVHHELQTHRDHVYAHETQIQAHQTQLQLQGTLIQTQHQVHETRSQMQQAEMAVLRETDCRRQAQIVETLRVMRDMRREMSDMQIELLLLRQQQRRARQPGPDVRVPDHQDASRDAG